jgi:hypothetical protein
MSDDGIFRPFLSVFQPGQFVNKFAELQDHDYRPVENPLSGILGKKRKAVTYAQQEGAGPERNVVGMTGKEQKMKFGDPNRQKKESEERPSVVSPGELMDYEESNPSRVKGNKPGHKLKELLAKTFQ